VPGTALIALSANHPRQATDEEHVMNENFQAWLGQTLYDHDGEKIGKVDDVYLDEDTSEPEWLAVSTGWFGSRVTFVPLRGVTTEGDQLRAPYSRHQVKDAPNAEADGQLSQEEEARLYAHYGMNYGESRSDSGLPEGGTRQTGTGQGQTNTGRDDAMTRSEEELDVSRVSREAGRARLRKWVDTERVQETVPVVREEARVEREPINDSNRDAALDGPEITESEHEIVLREDEVVANKRVEPKERVRLSKDSVTDEETVDAELRKERIEVEGDVRK
jgi:uncharacterized protein (TIGR02271 family)